MTVRLSTGLRNNLAGNTGFGATFDNGVIYIYSGPQPLTADSAVSGTLLGKVTVDGGAFAFGTATNGLGFDAPASGVVSKAAAENWKFTGIAAGTAGWFRLMGNASDNLGASTTLPRMDGSIGVSGADLNLSNISIAVDAPNTIDVFQFTIPAQ
jgi:hypothetical protein